jgi:hypothetical protein
MVWVVFLLLGGLCSLLFTDFVILVLVVLVGHSLTVAGILVPSDVCVMLYTKLLASCGTHWFAGLSGS